MLSTSLDEAQLKKFKAPEEAIKALEFQNLAMKLTREKLPKGKSLIGFIGGTWTLFTYAVEGAPQRRPRKIENSNGALSTIL